MSDEIFIIAEIGVNHNGDMELAKQMIVAAKRAGADGVKFQTFTADALVSKGTPKVKYQEDTTAADETHYEMIKKLELKRNDHFLLKKYSEDNGLEFISTPYDIESARFLNEELNISTFKTASADIVDLPLHEYIAQTKKKSIVSVGMANLGEIEEVVQIYEKNNNKQLSLLHCVSNYPCSDASLNLNVINTLRAAFCKPVGYSDHSVGYEAALMSVVLGAHIIEKHFTLDKNLPGPDHSASSTPEEFLSLSNAIRRAEKMLGSPIKNLQEEERQMALVSRKSITLRHAVKVGEKIERSNLVLMRPGTGLTARDIDRMVGKTATRNIAAGAQLTFWDCQ